MPPSSGSRALPAAVGRSARKASTPERSSMSSATNRPRSGCSKTTASSPGQLIRLRPRWLFPSATTHYACHRVILPCGAPTPNGRTPMTDTPSYKLISADSHVIEPPDLFSSRLPADLRDRAPKLESVDGGSAWVLDGCDPVPLPRTAATGSGYRSSIRANGKPISLDDVLPAVFDPAERLKAQDSVRFHGEVLYPSADLWDAIRVLEDRDVKLA